LLFFVIFVPATTNSWSATKAMCTSVARLHFR